MEGSLQRSLEGLAGVTALTRRGAESIVRTLVQRGEVAADRAERAVDELLARSERNREAVAELVRQETERVVGRLGLARQEDVDALSERVERLEAALRGEPSARDAAADAPGGPPDTAADASGGPPDAADPPAPAFRDLQRAADDPTEDAPGVDEEGSS